MFRRLTDADLSKVAAKVVPCGDATIRRRFAIEYLDIPYKEFTKISWNKRDNCEEVVFECLVKWRDKRIKVGQKATVLSLIILLDRVAKEEGDWISKSSYQFLYGSREEQDGNGGGCAKTERITIGGKRRTEAIRPRSDKYARLSIELEYLEREKQRIEAERVKIKQDQGRLREMLNVRFLLGGGQRISKSISHDSFFLAFRDI